MPTRALSIAGLIALTAGCIAVHLDAAPIEESHANKNGYIELTPDQLHWFSVPNIPKAQFAYLSGNPSKTGPYAFRVKLEPGAVLPPHYHPRDEAGTVLSGTFFTGMGSIFDKKKGHPLPQGSYAFIPRGMRHFAWVEEPTIVQVHGNGPWQLIPVGANGKPSGDPVSLPASPPRPSKKN
jgi:hypothetical protein